MIHNLKYNWTIGIYVLIYVITMVIVGVASLIAFSSDSEAGAIIAGIILFIAIIANTVIKCIYDAKWIEEVNILCEGDGLSTTNVATRGLLTFLTCGIYRVFWDYNLQTRLKSNGHRYDVEIPESGSSILLWQTLGLLLFFFGPLIAEHIMYQSTNKLAYAYNMGKGNGEQKYPRKERKQIPDDPRKQKEYIIEPKQIDVQGMIQCIAGSSQGRSFPISANSIIIIGKNPNRANFIIQESYISNIHCTVQFNASNNTYIVTDQSTNGTFVNGVRLQKNVPVSCVAGTIICLVNTGVQIKLG